MLQVIEIAFTGYPITDLARAREFYENVLGLKPAMVAGDPQKAWVEYEIGPGTLAISNMAAEWKPSPDGPGVALEVEDFESSLASLREKGVKFLFEAMDTPVCRMAIIADPDGNSIVIHKRKVLGQS